MCRVSHITYGLKILESFLPHSEWKQTSLKCSTKPCEPQELSPLSTLSYRISHTQLLSQYIKPTQGSMPLSYAPCLVPTHPPYMHKTCTAPCFLPPLPRVPAQMSPLGIIVIIGSTLKMPLLSNFLHTQRFLPRSKRMSNCL